MNELNKDNTVISTETKTVTRKEALKKLGYTALASTTVLLLLNNPTKVYALSIPGKGWESNNISPEELMILEEVVDQQK